MTLISIRVWRISALLTGSMETDLAAIEGFNERQTGRAFIDTVELKCQTADQEMFRHVGIEPKRQRLVAVKSSVHFRADFQPIAREVLVVKSPGPALADPAEFTWTKLRPGMRLGPFGPPYAG